MSNTWWNLASDPCAVLQVPEINIENIDLAKAQHSELALWRGRLTVWRRAVFGFLIHA